MKTLKLIIQLELLKAIVLTLYLLMLNQKVLKSQYLLKQKISDYSGQNNINIIETKYRKRCSLLFSIYMRGNS
jgi:hypothetical protein